LESPARVLVIDDEPIVLQSVARLLGRAGYTVRTVDCGEKAFALLNDKGEPPPDVVLTDLHLPDASGVDIVSATLAQHPTAAAIVMTGRATISSVVDAMRRGAYDYLVKPFEENEILLSSVQRALAHKRLVERNRYLEQRLEVTDRFEDLVGASAGMRSVVGLVETVASTDATVLVLGESGTGKELVVRAIHRRSRRRDKPFMAINCGALAESILESELFGHAKGAFTGAATSRRGLFEEAQGGTVFLDEVGELPPSVQVRLLRVLQEREVRPIGSNEAHRVDVRIVAATNRDLGAEVAEGRFRQDLFYRLNVVTIDVPPLRARMDDVPLLAHHLMRKHAARHGRALEHIEPEALSLLCAYTWPGNVRELENVMERAVVLCRGSAISATELPSSVKMTPRTGATGILRTLALPLAQAKNDFERTYLQNLLVQARGNLADAARIAGLDRSNLRRLLRRFALDAPIPRVEEKSGGSD
jgi:two-component system response regulator HydG